MALSAEEQDIFGAIDGAITGEPAAQTQAAPEPEVDDGELAADAAQEAALKAELEAAQKKLADAQAKKTTRRMLIKDETGAVVSGPGRETTASAGARMESKPTTPPPPAPKPETPWSVTCGCGQTVNAENGSKLQDGSVKHIGCPKDAPPPAPKKETAKKSKESAPPLPGATTQTPPPASTQLAAPAFRGESDTDRAARAASDAAEKARREKEQKAKESDVQTAVGPEAVDQVLAGAEPQASAPLGKLPLGERLQRVALSNLFMSIADLIRVS